MAFSRATSVIRVAGRQAGNLATEPLNRVARLPELVLNAFGVMPAKQLRRRVVVLSKSTGANVLGVSNAEVEAALTPAIELTRESLRQEARCKAWSPQTAAVSG